MKRTKTIEGQTTATDLDNKISKFVGTCTNVVDIKYQANIDPQNEIVVYSAMIIYEVVVLDQKPRL